MRKCNVCGKKFKLLEKNRYEVEKKPVGLNCLTQGTVYYNAFDCPNCGCQNIVGVVEKGIVRDVELEEIQNNYKNNDEISYTPEEVGEILTTEGQEHGRKYGLELGDTIKFTPTEVEKILKAESEE